MARPATLPTYATDATLSGGPQVGLSTRLSPGAGTLAQGFWSGRKLPARALGWILGTIGDWLGYFDTKSLHDAFQTWRMSPDIGITSGTPGTSSVLVGMLGRSVLDIGGDQQRVPVLFSLNTTSTNISQSHSGDGTLWQQRADIATAFTPDTFLGAARGKVDELIVWGSPVGAIGATNKTSLYSTNGGGTWSVVASTFDNVLCWHYLNVGGTDYYLKATSNAGTWLYTGSPGAGSPVFSLTGFGGTGFAEAPLTMADNGSGTIVACVFGNTNTYPRLVVSTDRGAHWALAQDFSGTLSGDVTYNKALNKFVAVMSDGKVWTSTTGATGTWSSVTSAASAANGFQFGRGTLASAGPAICKLWRSTLVGTYGQEGVAYSLDLGATWNFAPFGSGTTTRHVQSIWGFNGRIYAAGFANVWVSGPLTYPAREA